VTAPWRTLRGRLALASLVGLLTASLVFAVLGVQLVRSQTVASDLTELETTAIGLAKLISQDAATDIQAKGSYKPTPERIAALASIVGKGTQFTYTGAQLDPNPLGVPSPLQRRAIAQVNLDTLERDGVQRFDYTIPETGVKAIAAAAPITFDPEGIVGAAVVIRERAELGSVWRRFASRVLIAAGIGLGIAMLVTILFSRRALSPLKRLEAAARDVGRGDLDTRVAITGTQEIDALTSAFNTMVRELQHRETLTRDFLMRVTHDLRTPLTAIRGHTQALTDGVVPAEAIPRSLHAIEDESARLEALVTDLLDLAKLEARRFRLDLDAVDGNDLVDRAFQAYAGEATQRNLTYEHELTPLPALFTDDARVRQIIGNLIDNAFRWAPDGGTVRVSAHPRAGGGAVIVVADNGPGISMDRQMEIFEPFRSENTPDGQHGSGLGLAISRQLARALGGDLRVESRLGAGSRFILELPAEARQTTQAR
jgi:signal transduction histidine kinase